MGETMPRKSDHMDRAKAQQLKPWQVEEVKKGLQEADRGEFASPDEVEAMFDKWTR